MGFFKSPLGKKKKAKTLKELEVKEASPKPEARPETKASSSSSSSPKKTRSLAPPLFSSETDRQLLKNLKGTTRRLSLSSDGGAPASVETAKKKLQVTSSGEISHNSASNIASSSSKDNNNKNNERFMAQYGLSPFVGGNNNNQRTLKTMPKSSAAPLPSTLPLVDDDENDDDQNNEGADKATIVAFPSLPFHGSDSSLQTPTPATSFDERDTTDNRTAPLSPAGSQTSATNHPSSHRSITTSPKQQPKASSSSPKQLQKPASFRSPKQLQRPSSFRSPKQLRRPSSFRSATSPNSSFQSLTSPKTPQKGSSFRSAFSVDDESYVEEYILEDEYDEIEYYEEEIIEDEGFCNRPTKVKFDEYDEMQLTLNLNDYSDNELKKSWYRRKDYDEMIKEARQVAVKEEERAKQLMKSISTESIDVPEQRSQELSSSLIPQHSEARGLEAWTPTGAVQVRKIKEAAVEAVWNEQHRQWEAQIQDYEAMRKAYQTISSNAQREAEQRGLADQHVVDKIRQLEELSTSDEVKIKRRRASSIFVKGRSILGKSVKAAGKVARETGKRGARASVGAVTLDSRMLLEAIKVEKKKRDAKKTSQQERCIFKQPSLSARAMSIESSIMSSSSVSANGERRKKRDRNDELSASIHEKGAAIASTIKDRADKLKLLGVVPIPGTKKMYNEDRREKKLEKRSSRRCGYATWEASLAAEGKL